jgi:hypothetical protein
MDNEIQEFLLKHLHSIQENNISEYHETTAEDLTLYEWWVTPHRLGGISFHEFMMTSNANRGSVFGAEDKGLQVLICMFNAMAMLPLRVIRFSSALLCLKV